MNIKSTKQLVLKICFVYEVLFEIHKLNYLKRDDMLT